jgi:DNA-binding HxlR family transcriptional regulator
MIDLNGRVYTCPIDVTLSFIGGKWKVLILSHLHVQQSRGFSEIRSALPGISEKMLAQQLGELERDQLVEKKIITLKPYRIQYNLSATGRSLSPLFEFMSAYGIAYLQKFGIDYIRDQHLYK